MSDAMHASANFRLAAMDLARRLSSLQHYVSAANELVSRSEQLQPRDVARHARKIVALIEISRQTLLHAGLRLYHFATCPSSLAQHKSCFFDLLRMLKKQRCLFDQSDHELRERIDRLLLPLSSNLRIASAEDTAAPSSGRSHSVPLVSPPHSPVCFSSSMVTRCTSAVPRGHSRSDTHGKMLPPDVLMSRSRKRRMHRVSSENHMDVGAIQQMLQAAQNVASLISSNGSAAAEETDDRPVSVSLPQPRRRFGIFCTPGSRPRPRRPGRMG
ncbi:hypothetical protein BDY19DRAFT_590580 [Irpex rosettiformis]|uniref:Uncharacterized protein n=1 Tax=Irpex rosettiformis TaxID=378272 RepID=A0ACB8UDI4_9APHY|nr:hypothetical protein BDY19DRAFT_590580 [Irpex rosettiformis]